MAPTLLLASNSPRRRQLLALTGWTFTVHPVDIDESPLPGEAPPDYVLRLAESKARAAGQFAQPGQIVLAADTTVADGLSIMGKPEDAAHAREMLVNLRGRDHWVYTAIGVYDPQTGKLKTDLCATRVWMRAYSDQEIADYIASGDPFDKAGAYAIQHAAFRPVDRIEGCYACVVGLGVCSVVSTLRKFNLIPPQDVTRECQPHLSHNCEVSQHLLREDRSSGRQPGESPTGSQAQGKEI